VKSNTTPKFWQLFAALPPHARRLAAKNYQLWQDDLYTVRIGDRYRAVGQMESGEITWAWIGTHADYDKL
jgi:hypothetical protein